MANDIAVWWSGSTSSTRAQWMTCQKIAAVTGGECHGLSNVATDPEAKEERRLQSRSQEDCHTERAVELGLALVVAVFDLMVTLLLIAHINYLRCHVTRMQCILP